jgi:hypothetical protein
LFYLFLSICTFIVIVFYWLNLLPFSCALTPPLCSHTVRANRGNTLLTRCYFNATCAFLCTLSIFWLVEFSWYKLIICVYTEEGILNRGLELFYNFLFAFYLFSWILLEFFIESSRFLWNHLDSYFFFFSLYWPQKMILSLLHSNINGMTHWSVALRNLKSGTATNPRQLPNNPHGYQSWRYC